MGDSRPQGRPAPYPTVSDDVPPWREPKAACAQTLARAAQEAIRQLSKMNASSAPTQERQQDVSDLTLALETNQNFPTPVPETILPLQPQAALGEPPNPQGCLLPQLQEAEQVEANVLLLVTDSCCFLSIPHFPFFVRHLVARMQWEGTYKEKWFPIFVNTREEGLAAVYFAWVGPEILTVLRILAPGVVLMLLDHDTLFTARWEAEELRHFAVMDLLPNNAHHHLQRAATIRGLCSQSTPQPGQG